MAKFVRTLRGDFNTILKKIESGVMDGSLSATLEDSWEVRGENTRCAVRVFERYSFSGENRVSMNVTLYQTGDVIHLCAITSGGSQGLFFKLNTWGEEAFLDTLRELF